MGKWGISSLVQLWSAVVRRNQELIQLVAFRTTKQLCAEMERPRMEMIVGGACKPVDIAWHDYCAELCIASGLPADMGRNHRYKFATLFGEASSNRRTSRLCCMSQRGRERFLRSRVVLSRLTCSKLSTRPNRSSSLARLFDLRAAARCGSCCDGRKWCRQTSWSEEPPAHLRRCASSFFVKGRGPLPNVPAKPAPRMRQSRAQRARSRRE